MADRRDAAPRKPVVTMAEARAQGRRELFERLEALLVETRGNVAEMARRLGKDRSTVRYHLRRFGMLGEGPGSGACPQATRSGNPASRRRAERRIADEAMHEGEPDAPEA